MNGIQNPEAAPPTDNVLTSFVGSFKSIAQQEADAKKQQLDAKAADVRGVIEPRLAAGRALIAEIESAQNEAASIVQPFADMDWAGLRKHVPVTAHGETDTRGTITMLERAVRDARALVAAYNATTLRSTVARIEQIQQYQSLTIPYELIGLLDYEMNGSKELPNSLRTTTRTVSVLLSPLQRERLTKSVAYLDGKHPDHKEVVAEVPRMMFDSRENPEMLEADRTTLRAQHDMAHIERQLPHGIEVTEPEAEVTFLHFATDHDLTRAQFTSSTARRRCSR